MLIFINFWTATFLVCLFLKIFVQQLFWYAYFCITKMYSNFSGMLIFINFWTANFLVCLFLKNFVQQLFWYRYAYFYKFFTATFLVSENLQTRSTIYITNLNSFLYVYCVFLLGSIIILFAVNIALGYLAMLVSSVHCTSKANWLNLRCVF